MHLHLSTKEELLRRQRLASLIQHHTMAIWKRSHEFLLSWDIELSARPSVRWSCLLAEALQRRIWLSLRNLKLILLDIKPLEFNAGYGQRIAHHRRVYQCWNSWEAPAKTFTSQLGAKIFSLAITGSAIYQTDDTAGVKPFKLLYRPTKRWKWLT